MLRPSTDPDLWPAYRGGQVLALMVAVLFAFVHGVIIAGCGLVIALLVYRTFFAVMRNVVFPAIETAARCIGRCR